MTSFALSVAHNDSVRGKPSATAGVELTKDIV